jgi:O-methyltransferase
MLDDMRLETLLKLAREVHAAGVPGDFVECGVWKGGSAAVLASTMARHDNRRIWLFDNFTGMPEPGPQDGEEARGYEGLCRGSEDEVRDALLRAAVPLRRAVFRIGQFSETLSWELPSEIALLHVDSDWYLNVLSCLRALYPRVTDGGFVILDDFGHWEGTREAFYDFCLENDVKPLLERVGYTQAFWQKKTVHNRQKQESYLSGIYRPLRNLNGAISPEASDPPGKNSANE